MFYFNRHKIKSLLNVLLCLVIQIIVTFLIAFILHYLLRLVVKRLDVRKEYFPHGDRFPPDQQDSNAYRLKIAHEYLKNSQIGEFKVNSKNDIGISIIAAYRNKHFYLTQTLGYLLHELNATQIPILVCFVDKKANEEVKELQKIGFKFIFLYQNRTFPKLPFGRSDQRIAKESNDYWTCLNKTHQLIESKFVLLLEDDAVALPDFAIKLQSLVYQLSRNERLSSIDYVKLFHPWYLRKIPSFIQIGVICTILAFLSIILLKFLRSILLFYLSACILSVLLSTQLINSDKELISDLRFSLTKSTYLSYIESCCTQAVLFRSTSIPTIVNHLIDQPTKLGYAKDTLMDSSRFLGRMTDQNLFIHIGHYSAVRQNFVDF